MKESTVRIIIAGLLLVWCNICYSISSGDFEFSILSEEDKTVEVTLVEDYNKYVEELVFPNSVTIDGKLYKVISVGRTPITAGKYLYRVTLPDNIKRIADCAFGGSYLNRINIETDRLEKIGSRAFTRCSQLKTFDFNKLPSDPNKFGSEIFSYSGISEVDWPEDAPEIAPGLFENSYVKKVRFPSTLQTIGKNAFLNCTQLDTVSIPSGVKVKKNAFENCFNIRHLELGEDCELEIEAFFNNFELEKLVIPSGTKFPSSPFVNFLNLKEIELSADACLEDYSQITRESKVISYYAPRDDLPEDLYTVEEKIYHQSYLSGVFYYYEYTPIYKRELEKIVYPSSNPPYLNGILCRPKSYHTATLYVAPEGLELARSTHPWNNFKSIEPIAIETEIKNIEADFTHQQHDNSRENGFYTLTGVFVGANRENLQSGLYIERKNGNTRKIMIK